jgi:hypothetical protein
VYVRPLDASPTAPAARTAEMARAVSGERIVESSGRE